MKTLNIYISFFIFICISIIAGCNDNLISPISNEQVSINKSDSQMDLDESSYNSKFTLNPGETKVLSYDNTNLILIYSYSVSNCNPVSRDLLISSSLQADSTSLPCYWKRHGNFAFEDLSIKNIGSQKKTISVSLQGVTLNN